MKLSKTDALKLVPRQYRSAFENHEMRPVPDVQGMYDESDVVDFGMVMYKLSRNGREPAKAEGQEIDMSRYIYTGDDNG